MEERIYFVLENKKEGIAWIESTSLQEYNSEGFYLDSVASSNRSVKVVFMCNTVDRAKDYIKVTQKNRQLWAD